MGKAAHVGNQIVWMFIEEYIWRTEAYNNNSRSGVNLNLLPFRLSTTTAFYSRSN